MKNLLIVLLLTKLYAQPQIIGSTLDCHQGMIHVTCVGQTDGLFYLNYYNGSWNYVINSDWPSTQTDTFDITFSGIMLYDSMQVAYIHYPTLDTAQLLNFSTHCPTHTEETEQAQDHTIQYFNLSGQPIKEPEGFCIELMTYSNKQSWRKIYK